MDQWAKFLGHCLSKRLDADTFVKYTQQRSEKHPLPPRNLADILLRPTEHRSDSFDPLIPLYVQGLLHDGLLDVPQVLRALLKYSNFRPAGELKEDGTNGKDISRWKRSHAQAEGLIYIFAKVIRNGSRPQDPQEAVELVTTLIEWMKVLTAESATAAMMQDTHAADVMAVRVAFSTLLIEASENAKVLQALEKSCPKDKLKAFSQTLAAFTPLQLHNSPMIGERLEMFRTQTLVPLEPIDKKTQAANDELDQLIGSTMGLGIGALQVEDLPTANSRAGLYVHIHSLLVRRPLVENDSLFNYLHNRYQGDIQNTCIDLILASFDVLANAMFRNEGTQTTLLLRSFLTNKVPLLLVALSPSMFSPLSPEFCITEALSHVDTNTFPNLSSMFEESSAGNEFADSIRQDFLFACCLHDLIAEGSIEGLIGEPPMQALPESGRYLKDDLVQQCMADPERTERLLEELENMDGNVGAVSQAIVEIMRQYCALKETMFLKTLCSNLAKRPSSLDVLLLFNKPTTILHPICQLLDGWRYDDDQGEYQPVYEEFGSILLLVLAFVYRYNLSTVDLGLNTYGTFIGKLLVQGSTSRPLNELSGQEKDHLDGWIRGLFNSAEGGGLGDEPMSNCPPQEFYLLVPTLFHQVVLACQAGYLSDENLKGGLEFLVDTFLLPSLVGAISWVANHLWEGRASTFNIVVQILQILINPTSSSTDANTMLSSVLNIIAKPLEHSLRYLQRAEPTRQDVEPLSKVLKPHMSFSRMAAADYTELEAWTNTHIGGIATTIRQMMQSLTQWSVTQDINATPPSYTHRQLLTGLRILGAKRLLGVIIDEVKAQTTASPHNAPIVIDVATALICAPDADTPPFPNNPQAHIMEIPYDPSETPPTPLQCRLTLRDALRTEADLAPKTNKTDPLQAATVIRLFRRVEAMMTTDVALPQSGMLDHGLVDAGLVGDGVLGGPAGGSHQQEIDDVIEAAAVAAAADSDIMDVLTSGDSMMVGDDDLLGGMKLDF